MTISKQFKKYKLFTLVMCLSALSAHNASAKQPIEETLIVRTGQNITNQKISTLKGPCIIIPENVTDVRIQNNEIGPCGTTVDDVGIRMDKNAHDIYIGGNKIHDVSTAIYAHQANHPIFIDTNLVYDIRGPLPMGQMVLFDGVTGGSFGSRIFKNISDKDLSKHPTSYEDDISIRGSYGTLGYPILIACNKIRGGDLPTGSGIMVGKDGGRWFTIRDNIIVLTANTGIGIAGAQRVKIRNNLIWNKGDDKTSQTDKAISIFTYERNIPKFISVMSNSGVANSWLTVGDGSMGTGLYDDKTAQFITYNGNQWQNKMLQSSIWAYNKNDCI